ncbi:hypothetical protein GWO43_10560 [candidate division KSB1 bacterium]|nr:hypothetical protein [candidate division KSB1 bacterium]NIR69830.1 hypothetical protein [candidate division KSB1 bacterium]NIS24377.1 hypothetical protein [candidate division KSB1 bacterium]NIT71313.1 hypothetical protein [candidate division KSB1 bacterium]NIU27608.1 hypothetical protein [candidate division KSB1 bacterium]
MGDVYVDITVINDKDFEKQQEVHFLADTGATRARIPEDIASELDIQPVGDVPLGTGKRRRAKVRLWSL